jgi:hypothetical protein
MKHGGFKGGIMSKNTYELINVLDKLEETHPSKSGYSTEEILHKLGMPNNRENGKRIRDILRSLISRHKYPEFKTAGEEDIVYCPSGKNSGEYRLSKYR